MADLPWLRLYTDTVDNEKIRLLAFEDRWHFIALLCLMQQGILNPKDPLLDRKVSLKLGVQLNELSEVKRRLLEVGLIDENFIPDGWDKHQFMSDNSTSRVRKYRESKKKKECNVSETFLKRKCNAIESDTETEQIQKHKDQKRGKTSFIPPSISEILEYCQERQNNIDPENFFNFYKAKNWMIGKNKMKNWKACIITWEKRNLKNEENNRSHSERFNSKLDDIAKQAFENGCR